MASTKYKLGLVSFEMGPIATDGGMGTALVPVGDTVAGSASMTSSDDTKTDFNIEESDSPVVSIVSTKGKLTLNLSTYNNDVDNLVRMFGGTKVAGGAGGVATLGAITGGSGYSNGTYYNVPLTGGAGTNVTADITVAGGVVTNVVIKSPGLGYATGNNLSASTATIGAGTGFTVPVATIKTVGDRWNAPDTFLEQEQSIRLTYKQGGSILIPRAKVSAKPNFQFNKTALTQIDISADVLQPTKTAEPRLSLLSD